MNPIPQQRTDSTPPVVCLNCGEPVHLVNRALGPVWTHTHGEYEWCLIQHAEPVVA